MPLLVGMLLFIQLSVTAQTANDFKQLNQISFPNETNPNFKSYRTQTGTFQVIFTELFLFYKHFFSSQDANSCPFATSCSVYFIQSVREYGPIKGFLNGFDRYMRCNGLSARKYPLNKQGKLVDPVK